MLKPMLASLGEAPLADPDFVYEPKYDGIRAIAQVAPRGAARLWSRLGNEKTTQFPEVTAALEKWAARLTSPIVLDGELVALDQHGQPAGFQRLQGRIHLSESPSAPAAVTARRRTAAARPAGGPPALPHVAFILFDLLQDGDKDLRDRPLLERRAELERLFKSMTRGATGPGVLRLSELVAGDAHALYDRAVKSGWEGLIAKRAHSVYRSGKRSPDWRKIKLVHEQEFIVGGWTEPRGARSHFGALLLGVYDVPRSVLDTREHRRASASARGGGAPRELIYVGHTGTGFNERELAKLTKLLKPLAIPSSPFRDKVQTNERPHWVKPQIVVQVRFTEWTDDKKLRHPVYLGLRDDKKADEVTREEAPSGPSTQNPAPRSQNSAPRTSKLAQSSEAVIQRLNEIEHSRKDAVLELPDGSSFRVGNLHKVFWPALKLTKGDLLRYYCEVAPFIQPVVADRPLVMKRFPNGIHGEPFYQHHLDLSARIPKGVRIELVGGPGRDDTPRPQFVGGTFATLIYMAQLAAISQDPWFSRVQSLDEVDQVALDLDPSTGVPFARVLDVARWIRDELDTLGVEGFPKTSGADGLHVYIPMPRGTPYEAGQLFCHIIATVVSQKHPKIATIERKVSARGARVYVDFMQNAYGKTLATAYSARASEYAGVSTPLTWKEIDEDLRREDFTIKTVPARLKRVGDLWAGLRKSKGADLSSVSRYMKKEHK